MIFSFYAAGALLKTLFFCRQPFRSRFSFARHAILRRATPPPLRAAFFYCRDTPLMRMRYAAPRFATQPLPLRDSVTPARRRRC